MGTLTFIIILGIITSIFGKVKANIPKTQNKLFSVKKLDDFREAFSNKQESPVVNEVEFTLENSQGKYQKVKQEKIENQPVAQANEVEEVIEQKETTVKSQETINATSIINGVIWSEILGTPRSKKPYFSRMGYREIK